MRTVTPTNKAGTPAPNMTTKQNFVNHDIPRLDKISRPASRPYYCKLKYIDLHFRLRQIDPLTKNQVSYKCLQVGFSNIKSELS